MTTKLGEYSSLDIDKVLGKARSRIARIGVELEGGWKNLPSGVTLVRDGSIHLESEMDPMIIREIARLRDGERHAMTGMQAQRMRDQRRMLEMTLQDGLQIGELPSDPMELEKVPIWMKQFYPSVVNETCGLHVHMSFTSAYHYSRLMDSPVYQLTLIEYLGRWGAEEDLEPLHPIWPRLRGESEFCQPVFDPDRQALKTHKEYDRRAPGNRYTQVNYGFGTHGTIECRVLPMMKTADQGMRAVQRVIDITNATLSVQKQREVKLRGEVVMERGDDVVRERREVRI